LLFFDEVFIYASIKVEKRYIADTLRDSSGYPGEGFVCWLCAGVIADSPMKSSLIFLL